MNDYCVLLVKEGIPSIQSTNKFFDFIFVKSLICPETLLIDFELEKIQNHFTWRDQIIVYDSKVPQTYENTSAYTKSGDAIFGNFIVCLNGKNLVYRFWKYDLRALTSKEMARVVCSQLTFKDGQKYEL